MVASEVAILKMQEVGAQNIAKLEMSFLLHNIYGINSKI